MYSLFLACEQASIPIPVNNTAQWESLGFSLVGQAATSTVALGEILRLQPDLVLCDASILPLNGQLFMEHLIAQHSLALFMMMDINPTFAQARVFFRHGGFDYLPLPVERAEFEQILRQAATALSVVPTHAQDSLSRPSPDSLSPSFQALVAHLNENFTKKHTLDALGKQFSLSPNYICNLFAKHYDTTLTRYITALRMEQAKEQITQSNRPFKEIAIDCGYHDYYYFCRIFKEYFGVSPSQYAPINKP